MIRRFFQDTKKVKPQKPKHPVHIKQKLLRLVFHIFVWLGIAVVYYFVFSFFFDTPVEYGMKNSIHNLEAEYEKLSARYDTIENVLNNVVERDRNIFRTLYDSDPISFDDSERRLQRYDSLMIKNNTELGDEFFNRLNRFQERMRLQKEDLNMLQQRLVARGLQLNHIPSIQPVINKDLTLIATSFGMRIHPFYKTMVQHNGIDYAVPEGTRVFATADGTIARTQGSRTTSGLTVVISHGGGYETSYHHLNKVLVREGAQVKRGDIIALTGNSGLSLAPHLHYEVRYKGLRIDPVHYFFNELSPQEYEKVKRLAAVGMQSFD